MIIYTVTLAPYVDGIFNNGFSRQFLAKTEGTDYGDGVYCNNPAVLPSKCCLVSGYAFMI